MKRVRSVALTYLSIVLVTCERPEERLVAAKVAGQAIYIDEVDDLLKKSLYEYLFAIFDARSIAVNELINSRLLEIEAHARLSRHECLSCLDSKSQNSKISKSMTHLRLRGIEVTPTVLVDGRIYYGPLQSEAIGRFLDDLLLGKKYGKR